MRKNKAPRIELRATMRNTTEPLMMFALVNLGLTQSLVSGAVTPEEAIDAFYNAGNYLFVRREVRNRTAGRRAQLADLFGILPEPEARREFYAEIEAIRSLCLKLLGRPRSASLGTHAAA